MLISNFTLQSNGGLLHDIKSDCWVLEAFDPKGLSQAQISSKKSMKCTALWDTGATNTVITQRVAQSLGLKQTGVALVHHAAGQSFKPKYIVNIMLPNNVGIPFVEVTEGDLMGEDVLIGMDIITKGDFAITNVGGKTTFSFRIPSVETIDYCNQNNQPATQANTPIVKPKSPGRNDPCPCGSGKKYKHCCGRGKI